MRFSGGAVGRFLEPSPGVANLSLFGILRKPLRRAVRAAVQKAIAGHKTVVEDGLVLALDGRTHRITLIVQPISDGRTERDRYLVAFLDAGTGARRAIAGRSAHAAVRDAPARRQTTTASWRRSWRQPARSCWRPSPTWRRRTRSCDRSTRSTSPPTKSCRPPTRSWKPPRRRCSRSTRSCRPSIPS